MVKSCSLFFYDGYISVSPTIVNLATALNEQNIPVTIYITKVNDFPDPGKVGNNTKIVSFPKAGDVRFISHITNTTPHGKAIALFLYILQSLLYIFSNLREETGRDNFNIGVDSNGAILAWLKSLIFRQKYAFVSLELMSKEKFKGISRIIPFLEHFAYKRAACVIVQDEDRLNTLTEYNSYKHPKVFFLPNSATALKGGTQNSKTDNYFRNLFNLEEGDYPVVVSQIGMIHANVLSLELATAFASIKNGYALIFHDRSRKQEEDIYLKTIKRSNNKNLFLSLDPVPYDEIDKIFESITLGIAFYRDVDKNFSQISKASGKLTFYLKHGKPVLMNNLESFSQLVQKYEFGIIIQDPTNTKEIEAAIEKIMENYDYYSKNAKECFAEEFDFSRKVQPVISFLINL